MASLPQSALCHGPGPGPGQLHSNVEMFAAICVGFLKHLPTHRRSPFRSALNTNVIILVV